MTEDCERTQVDKKEELCTQYRLAWDNGEKDAQFVGLYDVKKCIEALFELGYGEVTITTLNESKY